jgi:hypothetical protein
MLANEGMQWWSRGFRHGASLGDCRGHLWSSLPFRVHQNSAVARISCIVTGLLLTVERCLGFLGSVSASLGERNTLLYHQVDSSLHG